MSAAEGAGPVLTWAPLAWLTLAPILTPLGVGLLLLWPWRRRVQRTTGAG